MDYTKFRNEALPPEQFHMFVERTSDARMTGDHRSWTGNDKSNRCHHGRVRLSEDPLYLRLHWKAGPDSPKRFVGNLKIKLRKLLINEYLREEDDGIVRLRFYRDHDNIIYIQQRLDFPGIPVGKLAALHAN